MSYKSIKYIVLLGLLTGCGSTIEGNDNTDFENRNGRHYKIWQSILYTWNALYS